MSRYARYVASVKAVMTLCSVIVICIFCFHSTTSNGYTLNKGYLTPQSVQYEDELDEVKPPEINLYSSFCHEEIRVNIFTINGSISMEYTDMRVINPIIYEDCTHPCPNPMRVR